MTPQRFRKPRALGSSGTQTRTTSGKQTESPEASQRQFDLTPVDDMVSDDFMAAFLSVGIPPKKRSPTQAHNRSSYIAGQGTLTILWTALMTPTRRLCGWD